jgi:hypothetical protein
VFFVREPARRAGEVFMINYAADITKIEAFMGGVDSLSDITPRRIHMKKK